MPPTHVVALFIGALPLLAEQSVLVVHIKDLHDHPIANVRLRAGDSSISAPTQSRRGPQKMSPVGRVATDSYGEARIRLAPETKPGQCRHARDGRLCSRQ